VSPRRHSSCRHRQRGVALLVAIVIFAIATTVAAAVTYNKAMAARRAAATFTLEHALQAGMAAEALASIALEDAASNAQTTLAQDWAQEQPPLEIADTGVWILARVDDMSARFNLNSVITWDAQQGSFVEDKHQLEVFRTLLQSLDIDQRYADLLVDWIDPDIAPFGMSGGEDTLYLSQSPPYRPPNTFIMHTSELLALPGFGRENYKKIAPYVTALPNDEKVNVCTASGLVLDAVLNQNTTQYATQDPAQYRQKGCWPEKRDYTAPIGDPAQRAEVDQRIDEKSAWFRLRTQVRIGTAEFVLYSVLYREPDGNKIRTVQRSFGSE
jgi:general secretion pathway protein K